MSYSPADTECIDYVRRTIAGGFHSPAWIADMAQALFEVEEGEATALVASAVVAHDRERATWTGPTDCERLDAAFAALGRAGIVARHGFACCNRCGHEEIGDEIQSERERGETIEGYVFYHRQDTDAAVGGGGLHLRFGTASVRVDPTIVGHRIAETLAAHDLTVTWSGDPDRTIELPGFQWKRRSPPPAWPPPPTAESLVARWTKDIIGLSQQSFVWAVDHLDVLVELDAFDVDAWRRAGAIKMLAHDLAASGKLSADEVTRMRADAFTHTPYNRQEELIDRMIEADLSEPIVFAAARDRVLDTRADVRSAAALAWFLVRAPAALLPEDQLTRLVSGVQRFLQPRGLEGRLHKYARVALASGLWILHARRGGTEDAKACRDLALEEHEHLSDTASHARHVAQLAAGEIEDAPAVSLVERAGGLDAARERFVAAQGEYDDGMITAGELRTAERDVLRLRVEAGERDQVRAELAEVVAEQRAVTLSTGVDERVRLRTGERLPVAALDEPALAKALAAWTEQRGARHGKQIVAAAATLAAGGDHLRARSLLDTVLRGDVLTAPKYRHVPRAAIPALAYLGELDRAIELNVLGDLYIPLVEQLAAHGRTDEALRMLATELDRATSRSELVAIAPTLAALAADPRAAVDSMLAAWDRADDAVRALV